MANRLCSGVANSFLQASGVRDALPNIALNGAPFGRWTLRDKAAQRPLAQR